MSVWTYSENGNNKTAAIIIAEDKFEAAKLINMELNKLHIQKTGEANTQPPVKPEDIYFLCSDVAHAVVLQYEVKI